MTIFEILNSIKQTSSSKRKFELLLENKDNSLLKRICIMTYDHITYHYYLTSKNLTIQSSSTIIPLEKALDFLENTLNTREVTGNRAIQETNEILSKLTYDNQQIFLHILDRDLKCWFWGTLINKVWKNIIATPAYMRCWVYSQDTQKNIKFPAILQLKADWTYREVIVQNGDVIYRSRSWVYYDYPLFTSIFKNLPNGIYTWEITIKDTSNRAEANGLLNSDTVPYDRLIIELWDYITLEEYNNSLHKIKGSISYQKRFEELQHIMSDLEETNVRLIPTKIVNSIEEALSQVSIWMKEWYEGGVLKDFSWVFMNTTSKYQLKLKKILECEMRITGFTEWTKWTSRESTFWAITFENDERTIKWQTSWLTQQQLDDFNTRRQELIGKVITIEFNDITKWKDNDYYSLSHPRFIQIRDDKDTTDTLERCLHMSRMSHFFMTKEEK